MRIIHFAGAPFVQVSVVVLCFRLLSTITATVMRGLPAGRYSADSRDGVRCSRRENFGDVELVSRSVTSTRSWGRCGTARRMKG
jgi:hypothetical protein